MDLKSRVDAVIDAALWSRIVGCVVLIHEKGRPVYARAAGFADREAKRAVTQNEIFRLASCTKPIVAAAALVMVDQGLLSLDDPVSKYLPFFTPKSPDGSAQPILVRHLLTHTSGITYDVPGGVSTGSDPGPAMTLEQDLRLLAAAPLHFVPGSKWEYGMSIDVLGGVVAAIDGNASDVEGVVQKYVAGPLGMTDTHFWVNPADAERLAHPYADGRPEPIRMGEPQVVQNHEDANNPDKIDVFSPGRIFLRDRPQCSGSSMAGTAGDFMKMLDAITMGKLFKPEMLAAAFANQIGGMDRPKDPGQKFGFLGAVIEDTHASGWPMAGMVHWGGIWGNNWIVEPKSQTTVVVFTNTMREGCNGPFREEVRDAVFA
jgi:CubicO group peptidase (beta-lactamase class C family)